MADQQPAAERVADPSSDSVEQQDEQLVPPQLLTLEAVQALMAAEPNEQFSMLPRVSPRGVDLATRQQMVQQLLPLLQSEYPDIRSRTATAISLFGEEGKVAIPDLLTLLSDTDKDAYRKTVWSIASQALARLGTDAIQPAMEMMPSAEGAEFFGITAIVSELGDTEEARATAPFYLEHLKSGPPHHRWASMYCLSKLGDTAKPAIPEYIKHLDDPNFNIKVIACRALAELGAESKAAVPKLVKLTQKQGNVLSTRTHAAMCLGAIGPLDNDVDLVSLLKKMIAEPNAFCQERGLIALGRLGKHAAEAGPFVNGLFDNEDFSQRPEAALALWKISGDAERPVEVLRPLITDLTYDFRALDALIEIGPAASAMADDVAALLETDDASMQLKAAEVLLSMGKAQHYADKLRKLPDLAPPEIAIRLDEIIATLE